jgi:anaerobic selenocysteine-containing dehydrogenase
LPKSIGFEAALKNVETVISFSIFPDETAVQADYIFPDHHGLESWGYQRATGSAQSVLSGMQPVVSPFYNTRSTMDVLIAASGQASPFQDEVEYIQSKLTNLLSESDGSFAAPEINSFSAYFQQHGGWWRNAADLESPDAASTLENLQGTGNSSSCRSSPRPSGKQARISPGCRNLLTRQQP